MVMESPTHFSLAGRSLKLDTSEHTDRHLLPLHPSTNNNPTTISLQGNTLGVEACQRLASTLRIQKQLEVANLADIFTGRLLSEIPPALSALLTALLECPKLHTVDLSDNAFGLNTVEPLVEFLSKHTPLQHLILQNNGLGPAAGAKVADALTALAEKKAAARHGGKEGLGELETVICGRNRLESGSMAAWARMYTAHASGIRTVKMVQNGIRQDGICVLLREGLSRCQRLQVLDLQDNTFTITGAQALAGVVARWPELRELGVGDSLLGARGAVIVAKEFGKKGVGEQIEVVRAQYNDIDSRGVKAFLEVTRTGGLPKLRRVELNGNKFSEEDEGIEGWRVLLEKRREDAGGEEGDEWGLDELDELESEDEEEEEEDEEETDEREEEDEEGAKRKRILKDADEVEGQKIGQEKDEDVDNLADSLGKTHV